MMVFRRESKSIQMESTLLPSGFTYIAKRTGDGHHSHCRCHLQAVLNFLDMSG